MKDGGNGALFHGVAREKILHNYLFQEVIHCKEDTYMAVMCNRCSKYKVTGRCGGAQPFE